MSRTVFISYSHKDSAFVRTLWADLQSAGIEIWIDHERLKPGTPDWEQAVREGIRSSRGVIYIASPDGCASPYVRDELRIAEDYAIRVFPIWANGERLSDCMPLGLGNIQHVDARNDRYDDAVRELASILVADACVQRQRSDEVLITNVASHSFGVVLRDPSGREYVRNFVISQTPLPIHAALTLVTEATNQRRLDFSIAENDVRDDILDDATLWEGIGRVLLELPSGLPAGAPVLVTFDFNEQGLLHITAKDLTSGMAVATRIQLGT